MVTLAPTYNQCAREHENCAFEGNKSIAYSAVDGSGSIYYRNSNAGNIYCGPITFDGDVSAGHRKKCSITDIPNDITYVEGLPKGFTKCGDEGGICKITNVVGADLLYGANGKFVYANTTNTPCSHTVFGDPAVGVNKSCYYREVVPPPPVTTTEIPTIRRPCRKRAPLYDWKAIIICIFLILIVILIVMLCLTYRKTNPKLQK